ncbi:uncharacterized protein LOC121802234 [Salvia splendens]|uniref:uncharacterized protein LOC121802234 n=1 Tax=Salvia splendens TaxID=180675 RepID=UPI001C27169F|nr:uncharacterized protein LOC121802234 [Salvia splendens]
MVTYIPPHLRGNQHPGHQQYNQPRYQQEHYGQSDYPQPNYSGGPTNQRYNQHPNEGHGDMLVPHHPNDAMREIKEAQKEQRAALEMLTKQLSQVAVSLGELKGNEATMQPPGRENISEVSLRSGKVYQGPCHPAISPATGSGQSRKKEGEFSRVDQVKEKGKEKVGGVASEESQKEETERVKPYPYRGMVTRKRDATIDVASMFKDVDVKVPLLTALKIPPISKFIKDYLAGKVNEEGRLIIDENVSAIIQRRDLPSKKNDPRMFTLPISIGDIQVEHAMCDLGASINVMTYSIYRKLGAAAKLVDTDIMIQLADRSCIHPEGILEDVIFKVNNFLYPADFFVIKMTKPATKESSGVLLGRSFLSTASAVIDVRQGTMKLSFNGEQLTFEIDKAVRKPQDNESIQTVDAISPRKQKYQKKNPSKNHPLVPLKVNISRERQRNGLIRR